MCETECSIGQCPIPCNGMVGLHTMCRHSALPAYIDGCIQHLLACMSLAGEACVPVSRLQVGA